jgi:hypothetical protein
MEFDYNEMVTGGNAYKYFFVNATRQLLSNCYNLSPTPITPFNGAAGGRANQHKHLAKALGRYMASLKK